MKIKTRSRIARLTALLLATVMIASAAPAFASVITDAAGNPSFSTYISPLNADAEVPAKVATSDTDNSAMTQVAAKKDAPLPKPVVVATYTNSGTNSTRTSSSSTSSNSSSSSSSSSSNTGNELAQAQSILAGLIARYPILAGTTVSIGDARGYQAIAYYKSGRIVISSSHTRSLSTILNHEVWHVIDWRDNGSIDWGENVPPK